MSQEKYIALRTPPTTNTALESEAPVADLQYKMELQQPSQSKQSQTGLLSRRLFELTLQDVQDILSSDQVGSG
ncbi:hypothetical protein GX50_08475 [[Emmonsia] crescens]|uniref:Uncharacterized protein n=1 Tax=[Emmonsia] crescens TaxID=73230 RepID=A0A2B7Z7J4_9EURO|nr:hypothetical protein GX50_08475 [Emmonsia crescens]